MREAQAKPNKPPMAKLADSKVVPETLQFKISPP
jgi:hypothetical protein